MPPVSLQRSAVAGVSCWRQCRPVRCLSSYRVLWWQAPSWQQIDGSRRPLSVGWRLQPRLQRQPTVSITPTHRSHTIVSKRMRPVAPGPLGAPRREGARARECFLAQENCATCRSCPLCYYKCAHIPTYRFFFKSPFRDALRVYVCASLYSLLVPLDDTTKCLPMMSYSAQH